MPIRPDLRAAYPSNWPEISRRVRFERAAGRCQTCGRPHQVRVKCLPDGRWHDVEARDWRDGCGQPAPWPDVVEATRLRTTLVVLAAAHLDHNPGNNRLGNLRALCQRCHLAHDIEHHRRQRWMTYRRRMAVADLFRGSYAPHAP